MTRLPRSAITPGSLLFEAGAGLTGRPVRSALTALGIAVGLAALVVSIGVSQSAGAQIVTRFHDAQASYLTASGAENTSLTLGSDTIETLRSRPGVTGADSVTLPGDSLIARARAPQDTQAAVEITATMLGAGPRFFETASAEFGAGRSFDKGHVLSHAPVAVIGIGVARRLGVDTIAGQPVVFVNGHQLLVIGILDGAAFFTQALDAIVAPHTTAADLFGHAQNTSVLVTTKRGSTYAIAGDLPYLLQPLRPEEVDVAVPPPPPDVANAVSRDLDALALTLAGVGAVVAAIGVTAIMTITVIERTAEIGLRRAFGASRLAIAAQFLLESVTIGAIGGMAGATLGVVLVGGAADLRNWIPVLNAAVPYLAVALGASIGLLAGTYPAVRAANIPPTTSLRG
jgi:ABC-type antimicrobial peptide transport system permease subunit